MGSPPRIKIRAHLPNKRHLLRTLLGSRWVILLEILPSNFGTLIEWNSRSLISDKTKSKIKTLGFEILMLLQTRYTENFTIYLLATTLGSISAVPNTCITFTRIIIKIASFLTIELTTLGRLGNLTIVPRIKDWNINVCGNSACSRTIHGGLISGDISISSPLIHNLLCKMTRHFEIEDENFGFNESKALTLLK